MTDLDWVASRTVGAPDALRRRTHDFLVEAGDAPLPRRLALAAQAALERATAARSRDGALDLLAADALITLALLAAAERDPAGLEAEARALRVFAA